MPLVSRDFCEKYIHFNHNGKYYVYSSSIPDEHGHSIHPLPNEKTIRGFSIYNLGYMQKKDDGLIHTHHLSHLDFKINLPSFVINHALPG